MSLFSHYEPCPRCTANGKDSRGDNLGVYRDGSSHCFSCGFHKHPKGFHAWAKPNTLKENNVPKSLLPFDFTTDVPRHAWQWLLQWELPFSYWRPIIGWSDHYERLVIRVECNGNLAFSIGRWLPEDGRSREENHKERRKWLVWGDSHKHCHVLGESQEKVVLVEDLISAAKIGSTGTSSIPLFGVVPYPCHLYYLLNFPGEVVMWLDKDQEMESRKKVMRLETILGKPVKVITTDKDPKALSFKEINNVI